jgi:hypothetical protein
MEWQFTETAAIYCSRVRDRCLIALQIIHFSLLSNDHFIPLTSRRRYTSAATNYR